MPAGRRTVGLVGFKDLKRALRAAAEDRAGANAEEIEPSDNVAIVSGKMFSNALEDKFMLTGYRAIAITTRRPTTLTGLVDIALFASARELPMTGENSTVCLVQKLVLDCFFACVITVDDHWPDTGVGAWFTLQCLDHGIALPRQERLGPRTLPFSGAAKEVYALMGIDADGILGAIRRMQKG